MARITTGWRLKDYVDLGAITATHGLSDGFSNLLVPVLALLVADLGLSTFQAGLVLSIQNVATLLFLYPLSMLADTIGRKKEILIIGLSVAAAAYVSMQVAGTFYAVAILAFLAGAGNAVYHPCGTALTARRFADHKAVAISFHGLGGNIGSSLMPLVQSAVVAFAGWRSAVGVCALPAAILLPLIGVRFSGSGAEGEAHSLQPMPGRNPRLLTGLVLRNRGVVLLALIYALEALGSKGMIGFLPLLASQRFGMDTPAIGVAVSTYFTAGIVAKPLMGYLYNRWGARSALFVPLALAAAFALAIGFTPWQSSLIPLAALLGICSPISPIILTAAADICDEHSLASSVGFIYTCHGLGFLSPLIGGWLAQRWGLPTGYVFFTAAILLGAVTSSLLPKISHHPSTTEASALSAG